jgi:hypothetical protein
MSYYYYYNYYYYYYYYYNYYANLAMNSTSLSDTSKSLPYNIAHCANCIHMFLFVPSSARTANRVAAEPGVRNSETQELKKELQLTYKVDILDRKIVEFPHLYRNIRSAHLHKSTITRKSRMLGLSWYDCIIRRVPKKKKSV